MYALTGIYRCVSKHHIILYKRSRKAPFNMLVIDSWLAITNEIGKNKTENRPPLSSKFFLTMVYIVVYTINERKVIIMMTAKVFENGRSQAVRLPKECRFSAEEVMVNKIGDVVILIPKTSKWDSFIEAVDMFSDDFMSEGRATDQIQEREEL